MPSQSTIAARPSAATRQSRARMTLAAAVFTFVACGDEVASQQPPSANSTPDNRAAVTIDPATALKNIQGSLAKYDLYGALDTCQKALITNPAHKELLWARVDILFNYFQFNPTAKLAVEAYLNLYPQDPTAHNTMGVILLRMGQLDAALASFDKAVALEPTKDSDSAATQDAGFAKGPSTFDIQSAIVKLCAVNSPENERIDIAKQIIAYSEKQRVVLPNDQNIELIINTLKAAESSFALSEVRQACVQLVADKAKNNDSVQEALISQLRKTDRGTVLAAVTALGGIDSRSVARALTDPQNLRFDSQVVEDAYSTALTRYFTQGNAVADEIKTYVIERLKVVLDKPVKHGNSNRAIVIAAKSLAASRNPEVLKYLEEKLNEKPGLRPILTERAQNELDKVTRELGPTDSKPLVEVGLYKALIELRMGQLDAAKAAFDSAVAFKATGVRALVNRAGVNMLKKDYAAAAKDFELAATRSVGFANHLRTLLDMPTEPLDNVAKAYIEGIWKKVLDGDAPDAAKAKAFEYLHATSSALAEYKKELARGVEDHETIYSTALALDVLEDVQGALEMVTLAIMKNDKDARFFNLRGLLWMKASQPDYEKAIQDFETSARLNPTAPHPHANMATCLWRLGQQAKALEAAQKADSRK